MAGRKPLDRALFASRALDVVQEIIAARGLQALNAREVAAGAGISVGTLYNVYGSLDGLIQALNARTLDQLCDALVEAAGEDGTPGERMAALARAYIEFANRSPLVWRAVFDHQPSGEHPKPDWYAASIERIAMLAIGILAPLFPPSERHKVRRVATIIWSGVHGICALAQAGNLRTVTRLDPRDLAEELVRGYLAGVQESTERPVRA